MKYWIDLGKTYGCGGEYSSIKDAKKEALAYARGYYFGSAISCTVNALMTMKSLRMCRTTTMIVSASITQQNSTEFNLLKKGNAS